MGNATSYCICLREPPSTACLRDLYDRNIGRNRNYFRNNDDERICKLFSFGYLYSGSTDVIK